MSQIIQPTEDAPLPKQNPLALAEAGATPSEVYTADGRRPERYTESVVVVRATHWRAFANARCALLDALPEAHPGKAEMMALFAVYRSAGGQGGLGD